MSNEYPMMLYRAPGPEQTQNGFVSTRIVADKNEFVLASEKGWLLTADGALEAHKAEQQTAAEKRASEANAEAVARAQALAGKQEAAPTRAELELKAKELGIEVKAGATDAKLAKAIAEKLAA